MVKHRRHRMCCKRWMDRCQSTFGQPYFNGVDEFCDLHVIVHRCERHSHPIGGGHGGGRASAERDINGESGQRRLQRVDGAHVVEH